MVARVSLSKFFNFQVAEERKVSFMFRLKLLEERQEWGNSCVINFRLHAHHNLHFNKICNHFNICKCLYVHLTLVYHLLLAPCYNQEENRIFQAFDRIIDFFALSLFKPIFTPVVMMKSVRERPIFSTSNAARKERTVEKRDLGPMLFFCQYFK